MEGKRDIIDLYLISCRWGFNPSSPLKFSCIMGRLMKKIIQNIEKNRDLYRIALYLGLTGYGGVAVIDKIKDEYVEKGGIISERKYLQALSLSQILPGSSLINLIAFFSYLKAGLIGSIIGTTLYILPTFFITVLFSAFYFRYSHIQHINVVIQSLNILLISLLINALLSLGRTIFVRDRVIDYRSVVISTVCFSLYFFYGLSVLSIISISGIFGIVLYVFTGFFGVTKQDLHEVRGAFFKRKRAWVLLLSILVFFSLILFNVSNTLWVLFISFLKIGTLAFGGGIAAIPLIESTFVKDLHLFTQTQFWDGISISQITPGPILIVSAFFGYKIAGILGALVATIGMCIPSVILIIIIGKIHERIKDNPIVRGVIRGFLAGFIGVLMTLIIGQIQRSLVDWDSILLALVTLALMVKVKKGFFISILTCVSYSFLVIFFK